MRRGLAEWLATWETIGWEFRDPHVEAGGDVAFARGLARLYGHKRGGEDVDLWLRATICFRRVGGAWKVAHEHSSVPFHMDGSYRAAVELRP